jgi:hydrogenase expression/formation protein HypC
MCLGVPGKVIETYREHGVFMGKIDFGGVRKSACLEHLPDVEIAGAVGIATATNGRWWWHR